MWAPTQTKAGHKPAHHRNVKNLAPDDVVIHYANGAIRAIGIVTAHGGLHTRPAELPRDWGPEGYLARIEYHDLAVPIPLTDVPSRTPAAGPFNRVGAVNQGYLYPLAPAFARMLYPAFADRWPIGWFQEKENTVIGWAEFIFWAKRFKEWPEFDTQERNYKIRLGEELAIARAAFQSGSDDWIPAVKKVFRSRLNNITNWRINDQLIKWMEATPADARAAITNIWSDLWVMSATINRI